AEDFAEVRLRLAGLPPASLRPRRVADGLHVFAVAGTDGARFNPATRAVEILVRDARDERALVLHPYAPRAWQGVEALREGLADRGRRLRFVAGRARPSPAGLLIRPTMLVFESRAKRIG